MVAGGHRQRNPARALGLNHPRADCVTHDSRRASYAQAFPNQQAVEFHSLGTDAQAVPDFLRRQILRDEGHDLSLARRQIDHTVRTRMADGSLHNPILLLG